MFDDRFFEAKTVTVDTPDDPDGLRFGRMQGFDAVSTCFDFTLTLKSGDFNVKSEDLLGTAVTVRAGQAEHIRYFHGLVDRFRFAGLQEGWGFYELTLRPALWFLSKTTDNRIFQAKSVVEIVEEVLGEQSDLIFETRLNKTYDPRDYCVQYGESDLDFVQRLLEHEGIYYFHEFADGEHKLILVDDITTLEPVDDFSEIEFEAVSYTSDIDPLHITDWDRTDTVVPGSFVQTDYDFVKPSADLTAKDELPVGHAQDDKEQYEYPGTYTEHLRGKGLATVRLHEGLSPAQVIIAQSTARLPWSGSRFKLFNYPREAENEEYCILRVDYDIVSTDYLSGVLDSTDRTASAWDSQRSITDAGEAGFRARYQLIPGDADYRPPRKTPKSLMTGPQTAVIVGPGGEEIHTDEYSRVKVQFHWDRLGAGDENSSCWVRVSSVWAGSGWGFIQIPRIGQEVIVDFLEGDPDQPIITGRVYNAEQMPPYSLPDNATQSGWKSNSSKGGGGWNELRFEDKKGSEEVYFQAEKDHNELVKNDESRNIGHDFLEDVGNDATQNIGHDRIETVTNNKSTQVGVDRTVAIGSNDTETVGANRSLTVGVDETISIGSNSSETIGMNHSQNVGLLQSIVVGGARTDKVGLAETRAIGGMQTLTVGMKRNVRVGSSQARHVGSDDSFNVGGKQTTTIGKEHAITVGKEQDFTVGGMQTFMVSDNMFHHTEKDGVFKAGKNVTIEAGDQITLKCGKASIIMTKNGDIEIDGKDVTIKGSGKINNKATGDIIMSGSKIKQN